MPSFYRIFITVPEKKQDLPLVCSLSLSVMPNGHIFDDPLPYGVYLRRRDIPADMRYYVYSGGLYDKEGIISHWNRREVSYKKI